MARPYRELRFSRDYPTKYKVWEIWNRKTGVLVARVPHPLRRLAIELFCERMGEPREGFEEKYKVTKRKEQNICYHCGCPIPNYWAVCEECKRMYE